MNEKELEMLELLEGGRKRIGEIAAALGIGKSYASMLADSLEKASLARKSRDGKSVFVEIPGNPKAILFRKLLRNYNCKVIFRGGREDQLILLLEPVTTHEVASRSGISTKSAYNILNDLRSAGVALEKDGKHFIDPGKGDVLEYVRMLKWEKAQARVGRQLDRQLHPVPRVLRPGRRRREEAGVKHPAHALLDFRERVREVGAQGEGGGRGPGDGGVVLDAREDDLCVGV